MTEFEEVLDECLCDLEEGAASMDECLRGHPQYAEQLGSLLLASRYLRSAREAPVPAGSRERIRAGVMREVYAHPRQPIRSRLTFMRAAGSLAAALLTLFITGTGYAQNALPGNAFYAWKLASENAWRAVSRDPVGTDLKIAARRADELIAVSKDPVLCSQALRTYLETTDKLKSELNDARVLPLLDLQMKKLDQSGVHLPQAGQGIVPADQPTQVPTAVPSPALP